MQSHIFISFEYYCNRITRIDTLLEGNAVKVGNGVFVFLKEGYKIIYLLAFKAFWYQTVLAWNWAL